MDDQDEGAEESIVEVKVNYDYLLSMPINSLTLEKVHSLPLPCLSILIADQQSPSIYPHQGVLIVVVLIRANFPASSGTRSMWGE